MLSENAADAGHRRHLYCCRTSYALRCTDLDLDLKDLSVRAP